MKDGMKWYVNDEKDDGDVVVSFLFYRREEVLLSPLLPEDWLAAVELERLMSPRLLLDDVLIYD